MPNNNNSSDRAKKIADLVALINGEVTPGELRGKKPMIAIDWGEEPGEDDCSVFLIDGKKVNRDTWNKEALWRQENKK